MTIYKSMSKAYVKSTLHSASRSKLMTPTFNLSAILGDKNGKVSKGVSSQIVDTTYLIKPGILVLGDETIIESVVNDPAIPSEKYVQEVSSRAFQIYNMFKQGDGEVVVHSLSVDSPLLSYDNLMNPKLKSIIGALYVETYVLYKELLSVSPSIDRYSISDSDLVRLDNNIRWLSDRIELESNLDYDLLECIRDLHRTILYVRKLGVF